MWHVVTTAVVRPTSRRRRRCSRRRPSSRRISGGGPARESNPGCARVCVVVVVVVCGGAVVVGFVGGSSGRASSLAELEQPLAAPAHGRRPQLAIAQQQKQLWRRPCGLFLPLFCLVFAEARQQSSAPTNFAPWVGDGAARSLRRKGMKWVQVSRLRGKFTPR